MSDKIELCKLHNGGTVSVQSDGVDFLITVESAWQRDIISLHERDTVTKLRDLCEAWLKR